MRKLFARLLLYATAPLWLPALALYAVFFLVQTYLLAWRMKREPRRIGLEVKR